MRKFKVITSKSAEDIKLEHEETRKINAAIIETLNYVHHNHSVNLKDTCQEMAIQIIYKDVISGIYNEFSLEAFHYLIAQELPSMLSNISFLSTCSNYLKGALQHRITKEKSKQWLQTEQKGANSDYENLSAE